MVEGKIITRGANITFLQTLLLKQEVDPTDITEVVSKAEELLKHLPNTQAVNQSNRGLMLGFVQSGKTAALTTAISLAADNGYRCYIILTSDNLFLYEQTIDRLKGYLQGLQIEGKENWDNLDHMANNLEPDGAGLVLITTKNNTVLEKLSEILNSLKQLRKGQLPTALIIDDEADQASLDTQANRRASKPDLDPGGTNKLIMQIRDHFSSHTYLQVTATPQALFLQDSNNLFRPQFTILLEPGQGYIGGNTFFSLEWGKAEELIRPISQNDLDLLLVDNNPYIPDSLRKAICTFYVGATISYLRDNNNPKKKASDLFYSFLCHISQKKVDHNKANKVISAYCQRLIDGLKPSAQAGLRATIERELKDAYDDLSKTLHTLPSFNEILDQLRSFMVGTEIQILNSDKNAQLKYERRYNILIGGTKLARGVTIKNLLVTYYGRRAISTNMDTMLQHARMYGYRKDYLAVTRLFVTAEVEERFRTINESEHAMYEVIRNYPNEIYRGIFVGRQQGLRATRSNVLNPYNVGYYVGGKSYFPKNPMYQRSDVERTTKRLDQIIDPIYSAKEKEPFPTTISKIISLIKLTRSFTGMGSWSNERVIASLEILKNDAKYDDTAFLVVRRDRTLTRKPDGLGEVLGPGDLNLARRNKNFPTLYMYRQRGDALDGWDNTPFWIPVIRFPDGSYALEFNFR